MSARVVIREKPQDKPKERPVCEYKDEQGFCRASDTQNPVLLCGYANYDARSYYPPCSRE
jgi:hypothetical protein